MEIEKHRRDIRRQEAQEEVRKRVIEVRGEGLRDGERVVPVLVGGAEERRRAVEEMSVEGVLQEIAEEEAEAEMAQDGDGRGEGGGDAEEGGARVGCGEERDGGAGGGEEQRDVGGEERLDERGEEDVEDGEGEDAVPGWLGVGGGDRR